MQNKFIYFCLLFLVFVGGCKPEAGPQGPQGDPGSAAGLPAGTIVAYGGIVPPNGWLLCDGASYTSSQYGNLFAAIGTSYGTGMGIGFNVPDLRGRFLRGTNRGSGNDPDAGSRTQSAMGGNTGDNVGSYQEDAFQGHTHWYRTATGSGQMGSPYIQAASGATNQAVSSNYQIQGAVTDGVNGTPRTASETRAKNVNVNFIIKY